MPAKILSPCKEKVTCQANTLMTARKPKMEKRNLCCKSPLIEFWNQKMEKCNWYPTPYTRNLGKSLVGSDTV